MHWLWIGLLLCGSINCHLTPEDIPSVDNDDGQLWVLLVAGSHGWYNYRHQADVSHSYQVVTQHGVPKENIIVMMYGDIAYNEENPTPGVIINRPNGTDVYKGVKIDYDGENNNPEIFLKVLSGHPTNVGTRRVIKSSKNDRIFVYFSDHGGPGIIAFGDDVLKATQLNKVIRKMWQQDKYNKMVFYIEACESGSMFENLLKPNINVFATTASTATESSFACYYDDKRNTYLGDVYSVKWLEDSDKEVLTKETLETQFAIVKNETTTSSVMQFGDLKMSKLHVSVFQGNQKSDGPTYQVSSDDIQDAVPSRDVPLEILKRTNRQRELQLLKAKRHFLESTVVEIMANLQAEHLWNERLPLTDFDCYNQVLDVFHQKCFNIGRNNYAAGFLYLFVNLCETKVQPGRIAKSIYATCTHHQEELGGIV